MANFETTDYAQMRRCRMAFLRNETVDEMFDGGARMTGFVQAITPDLICRPMRWTVTVLPARTGTRVPALQNG